MKKRTIAMLLVAIMCAMSFVGCGQSTTKDDLELYIPEDVFNESDVEIDMTLGDDKNDVKDEALDNVSSDTTNEDVSNKNANTSVSPDWLDMQFSLNGVTFTIGDSYQKFVDAGWTFDLSDYGYDNGYILNPSDKTFGTIELEHADYPDVRLTVGFINDDTVAKDITECDIWTVDMNCCYGHELVDEYPEMTVANGITWGATYDDIVKLYGEPSEDYLYKGDYYNTYEYVDADSARHITFTVYHDFGLAGIELDWY